MSDTASVSAAQYLQSADTLSQMVGALQTRLNGFSGNIQTLSDLKARADALASSATGNVQAAAKVLSAKGAALLNNQTSIQKSAQDLLSAATSLQQSVQSPVYSFLSTDPGFWGTRQNEILSDLMSQTNALLSTVTNVGTAMDGMDQDVQTYQSEIQDTEGAATGTGTIPKINAILSGTVSAVASPLTHLIWPVAIAAVAGLGLYAAFSSGMFKRKQ